MTRFNSKEISLSKAEMLFRKISNKKEGIKIKNNKLFDKKPFLLLSSFCERDTFSGDSSSLDTIFIIGLSGLSLGKELKGTITNKMLISCEKH